MSKRHFILTYLTDPGHGWLLVNLESVKEIMGSKFGEISDCSFISRNGMAALEEDCDMPLFLAELEKLGHTFQLQNQHMNNDKNWTGWRRF